MVWNSCRIFCRFLCVSGRLYENDESRIQFPVFYGIEANETESRKSFVFQAGDLSNGHSHSHDATGNRTEKKKSPALAIPIIIYWRNWRCSLATTDLNAKIDDIHNFNAKKQPTEKLPIFSHSKWEKRFSTSVYLI